MTGLTPLATTDGIILSNISFHPFFSVLCGLSKAYVAVPMNKMGIDNDTGLNPLTKSGDVGFQNWHLFGCYTRGTPT
ncbi:uncharacterized protein BT62DRAFT_934339 [Guyanagaster necrorhizus]|uniref:Uncharacterized protein n=1 Tax=Guyanagaster necrorhizus TaxID=856835 RepID=A0A9P7VPM0_9AGAR|nr:uncharacterized protein BT62DRAFT_934339 [Guyanagaster necrorhizus MCA 3950]KAG7444165.1 hypothetical protein BT62DRAFT_934339 [Guyanagaster necrorhizus MCA 3950]